MDRREFCAGAGAGAVCVLAAAATGLPGVVLAQTRKPEEGTEYLALGKAIISLPLMRALPAPLEHGVHIHYVDGSSEQIRDALRQISSDAEYRSFLEHNAREYHERYLSPAAMMRRLLDADTRSVSARPQ